ncbi:MAG: hypothetical protein R6X34_16065 [Chloroflexota bacterium]
MDQYQPSDVVLITFGDGEWQTAVVIIHQFPGMWVRLENGAALFITNTRHVRPARSDPPQTGSWKTT